MKKRVVRLLEKYSFVNENIPVEVKILDKGGYTPFYEITIPDITPYTKLILENTLKAELVTRVQVDISEILDSKKFPQLKAKFFNAAVELVKSSFPSLADDKIKILASYLVQRTLGLGELENMLADEKLEEIVINNATEPVKVFHKHYGWCDSNIKIKKEEVIADYASMIARKVGRQINVLNPILDAHLPNGDRVNATLFPISNKGNTITIRKFSKNPWTMPVMIRKGTISAEVAAFLWLCVQNELSLLITGGTGSGKTSFLNALSTFIPASQRVITIEDTRELTLPSFMHWVPLVTREPNPEGKGGVEMIDLMVNSLRMRPDRIIVGEIRRKEEAEVLFEAMHTGHSVYATLHADNVEQTISRLTTPPIGLPKEVLDALAGIVVTFRHRRFNIRRVLEVGEVMKNGRFNILYSWDIRHDYIHERSKSERIAELLNLYAGLTDREMREDVENKKTVLEWMVNKGYVDVNTVGHIVTHYYHNEEEVIEMARRNEEWKV
jgi:flagellar protein FlaI